MYNQDLLPLLVIILPMLITLITTGVMVHAKKKVQAIIFGSITILLALTTITIFISIMAINKEHKFPLDDSNASYHISCDSYYQLQYRSDTESESIVIGSAPDNLDDFCDKKLVQVEGRMGPFYGPPICTNFSDDPEQIEKCENSHIPVVHLTKIESLTSPPTYPKK